MFMGRLPRALRIDHLHHDLDQSLFCLVKYQQKREAVFHHERLLKTHQHNVVTTWRKQHIFMGAGSPNRPDASSSFRPRGYANELLRARQSQPMHPTVCQDEPRGLSVSDRRRRWG